jgi:hypothetical protein
MFDHPMCTKWAWVGCGLDVGNGGVFGEYVEQERLGVRVVWKYLRDE